MIKATTTVAILRGSTENAYGDAVDSATEVASGVPAAIRERARRTTSPVDGRPQEIYYHTGRLPSGTDVLVSDRLRDETTGDVYTIKSVTRVGASTRVNDLRLDLTKVQ